MKRLKFEVLVDIEESALDSFNTDFGKEELKDVIESELYRYLRDECFGDTNKFKLNIDCVDNTVESINKPIKRKFESNPKWLYRLEYKDDTCGLWYNGSGAWCFENGIGSIEGCKTRDLPMGYDERYKQDGRDWYSSCSNKDDLLHWYSLEDAKRLILSGFVFTRYLATEYHEYEKETVFIKDTALYREEIDIIKLFEQSGKN